LRGPDLQHRNVSWHDAEGGVEVEEVAVFANPFDQLRVSKEDGVLVLSFKNIEEYVVNKQEVTNVKIVNYYNSLQTR